MSVEDKRIYWQCRRGLLELDALLLPFYEKRFKDLSKSDQQVFVELLQCSDPELLAWIVHKEACEVPAFTKLIDLIGQKR